jgi:toxin ParE1/3/4
MDDLRGIADYVARDDEERALEVIDDIDAALDRLEDFPESGAVPCDAALARMGYRVLVVSSFLVFSTIEEETVEVHRVIHGRRRYAHLFGKGE